MQNYKLKQSSDDQSQGVGEPFLFDSLFCEHVKWYKSLGFSLTNSTNGSIDNTVKSGDHPDFRLEGHDKDIQDDNIKNKKVPTESKPHQELAWIWPDFQFEKNSSGSIDENEQIPNIQSQLAALIPDGHCRFATACTCSSSLGSVYETSSMSRQQIYNSFSRTNLSLLYLQSNISANSKTNGTNATKESNETNEIVETNEPNENSNALTGESYTSLHPSFAPIILLSHIPPSNPNTNLKDTLHKSQSSNQLGTFICIHDISPSTHKSLHAYIRSKKFRKNCLLPSSIMSYLRLEKEKLLSSTQTSSSQNHKKSQDFKNSSGLDKEVHPEKNKYETHDKIEWTMNPLNSHPIKNSTYLSNHDKKHAKQHISNSIDVKARFLMLQLLHALSFCHSKKITLSQHGVLHPKQIFIRENGWLQIVVPIQSNVENKLETVDETKSFPMNSREKTHPSNDQNTSKQCAEDMRSDSSKTSGNPTASIQAYPGSNESATRKWRNGNLTNLAYLLLLNESAGRSLEDPSNPPILPWVTDFSKKISDPHDMNGARGIGPWRDLSKSKYRLTKGDVQIDRTYQQTCPSHHLQEALSDISHTVYRARCIPLHILQSKVRPQFVPEHYPDSLAKMYKWTPDESILEFFSLSNSNVFQSQHTNIGLDDLKLPGWCNKPLDFVTYHRRLLEGDAVSRSLHLWIDLNFGEALSGERALKEKNVPLKVQLWRKKTRNNVEGNELESSQCDCMFEKEELSESCYTFVQLFRNAHPRRKVGSEKNLLNYQNVDRKEILSSPNNMTDVAHNRPHKPLHGSVDSLNNQADDKNQKVKMTDQQYPFNTSRLSRQHVINEFIQNSKNSMKSEDLRHQDFILVGMIMQEIYHVTNAHPSPDVSSAIDVLLTGYTGIQHLLWDHHSFEKRSIPLVNELSLSQRNEFQLFPAYLHKTYKILADIQCIQYKTLLSMNQQNHLRAEKEMNAPSLSQVNRILDVFSNKSILDQISSNGLGLLFPLIDNALLSIISCVEEEEKMVTSGKQENMNQSYLNLRTTLCKFIHTFGQHIGKKATDEFLLDRVMFIFGEASKSKTKSGIIFLQTLLQSRILPLLYLNSNMETFVRLVFPFLIKLLVRKQHEFNLQRLKSSVSDSLIFLVQEESLRPLFSRFIVPSFTQNMSDPEYYLSDVIVNFRQHNKIALVFEMIHMNDQKAIFKSNVAQCMEALISYLPYSTIKTAICKSLLKDHVPSLLEKIRENLRERKDISQMRSSSEHIAAVAGTLAQVLSCLTECVSILHPSDLKKIFFRHEQNFTQQIVHVAFSVLLLHKRQIRREILFIQKLMFDSGADESIGEDSLSPNENQISKALTENDDMEVIPRDFLQYKILSYLLNQAGHLISALLRSMKAHNLAQTVLPIVEAYSARLMRELHSELCRCHEIVFKELSTSSSRRKGMNKILSLPGVSVEVCLYETVLEVCGKNTLESQCPSMKKMSKWIESLRISTEGQIT